MKYIVAQMEYTQLKRIHRNTSDLVMFGAFRENCVLCFLRFVDSTRSIPLLPRTVAPLYNLHCVSQLAHTFDCLSYLRLISIDNVLLYTYID